MPDNQYPVFEGGQTLTAVDLNQLRTFLHQRDRLLGRLVGFGINCGLGGSVSGTTLTIGPGLAIDQRGEPLLLPAAQTIALPPTPSSGTFDFIATGPGGFSVVLESVDTVEPAPDCGETDCEGHAELHTRAVALRVVPGRITGTQFDFASETLLTVEPMRLSLTSAPQGSFVALRDALVTRLLNGGSPLISTALITQLQATSIAPSDLPGVKGYKAGFINQVLFATLDLLRCRALMGVACDRAAARPGVVLGWVHLVSSAWVWECSYRHAWEPPQGFSAALVGGTCGNPCGVWVDALEGLISGYAPPDPPPPADDDDGPGPGVVYCPYGMILVGSRCVNVYYPPIEYPVEWYIPWVEDPLGPIWNPPDVYEHFNDIIREVYQADPWEYFGKGVISGLETLGRDAEISRTALENTITDLGGTPNVVLVTATEATAMDGYSPAGTFSPSDTIVLTVNTGGRVVATGRVAAAHTARKLGTELPAATAKATEALAASEMQQVGLTKVTQQLGGLREDMAGFKGFEQTATKWREEIGQALDGVGTTIESQVRERIGVELTGMELGTFERRLSTAEGSLDVLVKVGVKGGAQVAQRLDQDFARGMVEFAETVNAGLGSLVNADNQKTLGRYVGDATRAAATLEVVAAGGDPVAIGDAAVTLMGTLRTAVKSAGIEANLGKQLDAQFTAVKGLLG